MSEMMEDPALRIFCFVGRGNRDENRCVNVFYMVGKVGQQIWIREN